eukprot:CAMPEP_0195540604 /NCGR_PEP_ID=MMETSP0794_2-20130614/50657_1 /TAXON_ID=515487 /ORGANISM="Stephanopyxis turris, Strain CCMP 815" /LENGTH=205 /DNA_ID=CAMNT_0040674673 /DNA_START=442 /DNA_END=1059 /DNA_ORIENTATION=+
MEVMPDVFNNFVPMNNILMNQRQIPPPLPKGSSKKAATSEPSKIISVSENASKRAPVPDVESNVSDLKEKPAQEESIEKQPIADTMKTPNKPKRPLSAYNYFFRYERARLIGAELPVEALDVNAPKRRRVHRKTHGKIGFADLAKHVSNKWKELKSDARAPFETLSADDMVRYKKELIECDPDARNLKDSVQVPDREAIVENDIK